MGGAETGRPSRPPVDPRFAVPALAVAMAASAVLALWLARDTTFSIDELVWFSTTPTLDLEEVLQPHGGHLVAVSRMTYKVLLEAFGAGSEAVRVLAFASLALAVGLLFVWASRRVGRLVALAPAAVLLVFGSDAFHVLVGNGFTILFAISCGLGALLSLDRGDRLGDLLACALLCLGIATYTTALAFLAGVAVSVLLRDDRWRRAWIFLVPVGLYAAWWLWALGQPSDAESQLVLSNLLLFPAWVAQGLAAVLGSLSGLDYDFTGVNRNDATFGPLLAVGAFAALVWLVHRRGAGSPTLWVCLTIMLALFLMQDLVGDDVRTPYSNRYLLPGAFAVLLVAFEAVRGLRWTRAALITLYLVAGIGLATNIALLRDVGAKLRNETTPAVRAAFAGLDLAGDAADPGFNPADELDPASPGPVEVTSALAAVESRGYSPTGAYLDAVARYGELGYSEAEVRGLEPELRASTDAFLAGALDLGLRATAAPDSNARCREARPSPGEAITAPLPPGGALLSAVAASGPVTIGRFADQPEVPVGTLTPGQFAVLEVPSDEIAEPWTVSMPGARLFVCPLA